MPTSFKLIATTPDTRVHLVDALAEHGVAFHSEGKVVVVEPDRVPEGKAGVEDEGSPERVVAMLREVLSVPERETVSVVEELSFPDEFPVTTRLEAWWSVFETSWFERALAANAFSVWFQPLVDTMARRTIGYECLLRLTKGHRRDGAEIMATAATRRDLRGFDSYTRQLAIRAVAEQRRDDKKCFMNFIPSTLSQPASGMRETMEKIEEAGLSPENFVMEAVESNRNPDIALLRRIGDYFRGRGLGFALDDVGAGPDALRLVCELRPDYIKLEKRLVHCLKLPHEAAAVRKLAEVAERLGVRVMAKGVERVSTMELLWAAGVQCMQGYLFGSPTPEFAGMEINLARLARAIEPSEQPDGAGSDGWARPEVAEGNSPTHSEGASSRFRRGPYTDDWAETHGMAYQSSAPMRATECQIAD